MSEPIDYCMHYDCKSTAVINEIEGTKSRCLEHKMDDTLYRKTIDYIKRARDIHGAKYDYTKTYYIHHREKLTIICKTHGDFYMRPDGHLGGNGCQKCGFLKKNKNTTEEFIEKARKKHGENYDYSKTDYIHNKKEVIIICPSHGEFIQKPSNHLSGNGCTKCGFKKTGIRHTCTTEEFIEKARIMHGEKYNYDKVNYQTSTIHVTITCPIHGNFQQVPSYHLSGNGCQKCGIEKQVSEQRYTTEEFIEKARLMHGNKYDYSNSEYVSSSVHITILCPKHGPFIQLPTEHIYRSGCRQCGITSRAIKQRKTLEAFIEKARTHHGDKYDYSVSEYTTINEKMNIKCHIHGIFVQTASAHLSGNGCQACAIQSRTDIRRADINDLIMRANEIHNSSYDYSQCTNYMNNRTVMKIVCHKKDKNGKEHGIFEQTMHAHLIDKNGCPRCVPRCHSKVQIEWLDSITEYTGIYIQHAENDIEHRIKGTYKHADGYSSATNTIFEFHGCYYHGCKKCFPTRDDINRVNKKTFDELYEYTLNKEGECRNNGYNLITIWQCDWQEMKKSPIELFKYMNELKKEITGS